VSTARALSPAIRAAAEGREIRLGFAIGPEFVEVEPVRCGEDTMAGVTFGLGHHSARKRWPPGYRRRVDHHGVSLFAWMAPCEMRTFGLDDAK
jgi:hypothetical protein